MERDVVIRQIIIVTDGGSNAGGDPIEAAKMAYEDGIFVNTIGVIEQKGSRADALEEIVHIAKAGGGSYEYSYIDKLFETMQSLTYKTVNKTLKDVVSRQLKEMIGEDINGMEPKSRSKILNYIDDFSDNVGIRCCILLDTSASMDSKIPIARYSILDLINSLNARRGKVEIAVLGFPGDRGSACKLLHNFGDPIDKLEGTIYKVSPKGETPTALAIKEAIKLMDKGHQIPILSMGNN